MSFFKMTLRSFKDDNLLTVSEALDIAEDKTGNFFKFSLVQWKRHHYDIKTLSSLKPDEISDHAFALLNKGSRVINDYDSKTKKHDFYFICLQDHQILKALGRDRNIGDVPSYVTGPASRACGGCHRAVLINEDKASELASFMQHTRLGGYLIEAGDDATGTLGTVIDEIMAIFK